MKIMIKEFPLSWAKRTYFGLVAMVGTAAFMISFSKATTDPGITRIFDAVSVAAPSAWLCLGLRLGVRSLRRGFFSSIFRDVDLCLLVMKTGNYILLLSIALNILWMLKGSDAAELKTIHLFVVASADVAMAYLFTTRSKWIGMSKTEAFATWLFLQNGVFGAVLYLVLH